MYANFISTPFSWTFWNYFYLIFHKSLVLKTIQAYGQGLYKSHLSIRDKYRRRLFSYTWVLLEVHETKLLHEEKYLSKFTELFGNA